ncbi:MAG: ABC transporter permease [Granulosicoccus sp.]|nr:ABC transporter permease [Granulosicoccus sp.]
MSILIVMIKEIIDNLRDRQTLFYALLFGPILLPLIICGTLVSSFKQLSIDFEEIHTLPVLHSERAPNLIQFLYSQNIDIEAAPQDIEHSMRQGESSVVLEIPENFSESLRSAQPASVIVHLNSANKESAKSARRITTILSTYEQSINALRLQHRGIDPNTFNALDITQNDISEEGSSGQLLASLLPFLFIMSMVLGGYYLAIDTTAGERERQSLEPLLSLPVSRSALLFGKYAATLCFVTLSTLLTTLSIYAIFRFFPVELLEAQVKFNFATLTKSLLLASPLLLFISALLITVSAITRSTKQAQTYLGLMMIFPMAPFFLLQFLNIRSTSMTMFYPMLSQYQLLGSTALGDEQPWHYILLSVGGTLLGTGLLLFLAIHLYRKERILM